MTPESVLKVVDGLAKELERRKVPKKKMAGWRTFHSLGFPDREAHAHYLCDNIKEMLKTRTVTWEDGRKIGSHLTSIQMCLSFADWFSLDVMRHHNYGDLDPSIHKWEEN